MRYELANEMDQIKFAREAAAVRRCHTLRTVGSYDVGQHSFGMLTLLAILKPDASAELMRFIIAHDTPERLTGDHPRTAKWAGLLEEDKLRDFEDDVMSEVFGDISLPDEERGWFIGLDMLELYLWAKDQINLGNLNVRRMMKRIDKWFYEKQDNIPGEIMAVHMAAFLDQEWEITHDLGDDDGSQ